MDFSHLILHKKVFEKERDGKTNFVALVGIIKNLEKEFISINYDLDKASLNPLKVSQNTANLTKVLKIMKPS